MTLLFPAPPRLSFTSPHHPRLASAGWIDAARLPQHQITVTKLNSEPDFLLTITPAGHSRFVMRLTDEDLGTTDTPLYTAARILIDRGHDPEAVLAMKHVGSDIVSMRGRIGRLAGWSISDGPNGSPHLIRYRPMAGRLRPTTA